MQNNYAQYLRNEYPDSFVREPFANLIYKKINKQIPSTNEMNNYSSIDKRPEKEKSIIYAVIYEYIHIDIDVIYLIDPIKKEPGILLKMTKAGINYAADEAKPFIIKGIGATSLAFGTELLVRNEWAKYLNRLNNRPDKLWRNPTSIKYGKALSNILRNSSKVLKLAGKGLEYLGTAMIYYDILSAGSPSLITSDTLIEATQQQLSRLCQKLRPYNI